MFLNASHQQFQSSVDLQKLDFKDGMIDLQEVRKSSQTWTVAFHVYIGKFPKIQNFAFMIL